MVLAAKNQEASVRDIDPNVLQRRASNPESSVWVNASAGTGKTKVLTDRVLRILLPRENGEPGTAAHKILCLTFTKAAANEMALRISKTLSEWATLDEHTLNEKLKKLLGRAAKPYEITAARKLFAQTLDIPGGLKIMTIHSFCQSVLGRFPLEAAISPNFQIMEEAQASEILIQAQHKAFKTGTNDKTHPVQKALNALAQILNEEQLSSLIQHMVSERNQIKHTLEKHFNIEGLNTALCKTLNIQPGTNIQAILKDACTKIPQDTIKTAAQTLWDKGSKTDQSRGQAILDFLKKTQEEQEKAFTSYQDAFLTKDKTIRAKLCSKKIHEQNPAIAETLQSEAERLLEINEHISNAHIADYTHHLFTLCDEVLNQYETLKAQHAFLDFDDLIIKTAKLLKTRSQWVHYKLDQGLDHILVDEAQDTNPEQWAIIEALCDDFFAGQSTREHAAQSKRTIFVVGDDKQSIYSFQRASPEEFARMQNDFKTRIENAGQDWQKIDLNISFRSTPAVLETVDKVFVDQQTQHISFRRGQEGNVELWPLTESTETEKQDLWDPPIQAYEHQSAPQKLAQNIAEQVKDWIDNKDTLKSRDRAIKPGDIMVLVRTRNVFVEHLIRALKNKNIPVSGADRMMLKNQIAVQDMIAALKFILLPEDDLNLACLLKSPLIGLNEDDLFKLAYDREHTLWDKIQNETSSTQEYLHELLRTGQQSNPYSILKTILDTPCPANEQNGLSAMIARLGKDIEDPLNELLHLAIDFEKNTPATLQHFVQNFEQNQTEIKREGESSENIVRIMTVHGSKGLQAPIIILPDTTSTPKGSPTRSQDRLLWPNQTGLSVPLWSPKKDTDSEIYKDALDQIHTRHEQEYRRLLYVAMTRAEDRLYIGGYKNKSDPPENCWYTQIENALPENMASNPQIHEPDRVQTDKAEKIKTFEKPDWLHKSLEAEETATRLRPSKIEEDAISPLQNDQNHRFLRGNLTHKLLQLLPDIPLESWENKAKNYLKHFGNDLNEDTQYSIVTETLKILKFSEFAEIFGPNSMAEVPITGYIDEALISGQIDRLLIKDNEILVIDYKTNRPPPENPADIPQIYRTQMQTYKQVLQQIYPAHTIKCALLWTDGPFLMPLDVESE